MSDYPPEWDSIPFVEMGRRYEAGEFAVEPFTKWCAATRTLAQRNAHLMRTPAPAFLSWPSTLLDCDRVTSGEADAMLRDGRMRADLYEQFRQLWRLGAPRFSEIWEDTEKLPVHPRVAEMLAIIAARRAAGR
jgi:hypothetical protein